MCSTLSVRYGAVEMTAVTLPLLFEKFLTRRVYTDTHGQRQKSIWLFTQSMCFTQLRLPRVVANEDVPVHPILVSLRQYKIPYVSK